MEFEQISFRSKHGNRRVNDRLQLLRAHPVDHRPRAVKTIGKRCLAQAQQCAGRRFTARSRQLHLHVAAGREARRTVRGHRWHGHAETGDPRGRRAAPDALRAV